jgi:hypothetical protein
MISFFTVGSVACRAGGTATLGVSVTGVSVRVWRLEWQTSGVAHGAAHARADLQYCRPPMAGLDDEMDCRGLASEEAVSV